MAVRIYELAKELRISNKILVNKCINLGMEVKSHLSSITDDQANSIKSLLRSAVAPTKKPEKKSKRSKPDKKRKKPEKKTGSGFMSAALKEQEIDIKIVEKSRKTRPIPPRKEKKKDTSERKTTKNPKTKTQEPQSQTQSKSTQREDIQKKRDKESSKQQSQQPPKKEGRGKDKKRSGDSWMSKFETKEYRRGGSDRGRFGRHGKKGHKKQKQTTPPPEIKDCVVEAPITVRSLSSAMGIKVPMLLGKLMKDGFGMLNINTMIDNDQAMELALEFDKNLTIKEEEDLEKQLTLETPSNEDLIPRSPVVAFLGHVDHGKTTLLDYIRSSRVAEGEAGGITQHVAAYVVEDENSRVVFLDTPGHEAFTEMRSRGAHTTDIVVLIVAADDGVMPQTVEAISHARAAKVPIVVAITKIDKTNANIDNVKSQLSSNDLLPEEWGGETLVIPVSGITGEGVDDLLEALSLQSEIMELKASAKGPARGKVLEAHISEGRGIVATLLVQSGTINKGDMVLCSHGYGNARLLHNDRGQSIDSAGPSTPIEISGLSELPDAGDDFYVVNDQKLAQKIAAERDIKQRQSALTRRTAVTLEGLSDIIAAGKVKELPLIIKADVIGSLEVVESSLLKLSNQEVKVVIVHKGIGGITDADVNLAEATNAILIGLHVVADHRTRQVAEIKGVEIRSYRVIFQAIEDVKKALEGLLEPEEKEVILGHLEIKRVFSFSKVGNIAGTICTDGKVGRNNTVRLVRAGIVLWTGKLNTLKREKDDIKEVSEGHECGCTLSGYNKIEVGDVIEAFKIEKIARTLT